MITITRNPNIIHSYKINFKKDYMSVSTSSLSQAKDLISLRINKKAHLIKIWKNKWIAF